MKLLCLFFGHQLRASGHHCWRVCRRCDYSTQLFDDPAWQLLRDVGTTAYVKVNVPPDGRRPPLTSVPSGGRSVLS